MSLSTTVVDSIDNAFTMLGDLVGEFTVDSTAESFNDDTNEYTEDSVETDYTGFYGNFDFDEMDNVNVLKNDVRIYLKAEASKPMPAKGDTIKEKGGTVSYVIVSLDHVRTYQKAFLYDVQARE